MSSEAHFHLPGYVKKQNFRYWSYNNPMQIHAKYLHIAIWCHFVEETSQAVTVYSER
jgi:hypothetical protein